MGNDPVPPPMEPVLVPDPGDDPPPGHPLLDPDWAGEVKWDGVRLLAACGVGEARLFSRRLRERTAVYPEVRETLAGHGLARRRAVLDGEVVVFVGGRPSFPAILRREKAGPRAPSLAAILPAAYLVFDLLALDGGDLLALAWDARRRRLEEALGGETPGGPVRLSPAWSPGLPVLRQARARQLEGVVLKRRASRYAAGRRSRDWLKIKVRRRLEAVVGGFATRRGRLSSLLLGLHRPPLPGEAGDGGAGIPAPPGGGNGGRVRRRPPRLRGPRRVRFLRGRVGKAPQPPVPPRAALAALRGRRPGPPPRPGGGGAVDGTAPHGGGGVPGMDGVPPSEGPRVPGPRAVGAGELPPPVSRPLLSNLDKVLWPQAGLTKADYLRYLEAVSARLLPYLRGRPLLLVRCPDGAEGNCFFWRERPEWAPPWVPAVPVPGGRVLMTCEDLATLVWLGNLACLEIHTWSARLPDLHLADQLVLDLDPVLLGPEEPPDGGVAANAAEPGGPASPPDAAAVREAAAEVRTLLDSLGLRSWPKTSGGRGFHVHVPLERPVEHDRAAAIARDLARAAQRRRPDLFSLERSPARRRRPVYLDYLQNGRQKTIVAPFSPRRRGPAPVAWPFAWVDLPAVEPAGRTMSSLLAAPAATDPPAGRRSDQDGRSIAEPSRRGRMW